MTAPAAVPPTPGEEWDDLDPRQHPRRVRVVAVESPDQNPWGRVRVRVLVELVRPARNVSTAAIGRRTRVGLARFHDDHNRVTGYARHVTEQGDT